MCWRFFVTSKPPSLTTSWSRIFKQRPFGRSISWGPGNDFFLEITNLAKINKSLVCSTVDTVRTQYSAEKENSKKIRKTNRGKSYCSQNGKKTRSSRAFAVADAEESELHHRTLQGDWWGGWRSSGLAVGNGSFVS